MARLNAAEQEQSAQQLARTLMVLLVGVFVVLFLLLAVILPTPRPEPIIELPFSASAEKAPEFEEQLTVSIQSSGATFVRDEPTTRVQLVSRLRALHRRRTGDVLLRARVDRTAPFAAVRMLLLAAREAHVRTITILVRPRER